VPLSFESLCGKRKQSARNKTVQNYSYFVPLFRFFETLDFFVGTNNSRFLVGTKL